MKILAIILIALGVLGLVYGGFTYTSRTHRTSIGPVELAVAEKNTVNVPLWAGVGAVAVGGGLFFVASKRRNG